MSTSAEANCLTCQLVGRRDRADAPAWDSILRTDYWDLVDSYDTSLLGWLVLVTRRHITRVADVSDEEAAQLGSLLRDVSRALQDALSCQRTYVVQFAEAKEHPHVHFHIIARIPDLPEEAVGDGIFAYLGRPENERISENAMNDLTLCLRHACLNRRSRAEAILANPSRRAVEPTPGGPAWRLITTTSPRNRQI